MNINELPDEVLARIVSFLPRSDRLESALTCRRWAQTIARTSPLLRDIWLVLDAHDVGGDRTEEAGTVFANSHRHYENLRLQGVDPHKLSAAFWTKVGPSLRKLELQGADALEWDAAFWTKVGPTLRKLKLNHKYCSSEVFFSILQACSNLESLKIRRIELFELLPAINHESIKKSMFNLRHLHLHCVVDLGTLERLLILMPNASSIGLMPHESEFSSRLPNMLGARRGITMLDLTLVSGDDECEQLLSIASASLRTLRIYGDIFVPRVLDALINCSMLRDLTLWSLPDTRLLLNILRNVPELESLSISDGDQEEEFRQEDLMAILHLRKLRKLSLCCKLDSTSFRILASMPNLRELVIRGIQWDAECLRIVLSDLGKLRKLEIRGFRGYFPSQNRRCSLRDQHSKVERNMSTPQDSVSSHRQGEQRFSSLEVLITKDIPLCDSCLALISSHHIRLKIVKLLDCRDITNTGLVTLFQREPFLEKLFVDSKNLDGTFLEGLGELCRRLRSLEVNTQGEISTQARERFKLRRPRVKCRVYKGMIYSI